VGSGAIYGMPRDWSPDHTLFVNERTFEDAGLEVPADDTVWTYWDVADLARQLVRIEGTQVVTWGYAYSDFWQEGIWENMLLEVGKSLYRDSCIRFNAGDEDVEAIIRYYYDLAEENLVASPRNPSAGWTGGDFADGNVAIGQFGYWFVPFVYGAEVEGQVRMLPGPMWSGVRRNPTISGAGTMMAAATTAPDAAWLLFEWYHGLEPAVARAASGMGVPSLKSLYELLPSETEYQRQTHRVVLEEIALATPPIQFNPFASAPVAQAYSANLAAALAHDLTFDELLAEVESAANRAIADGLGGT
jgi:multiple sugar transport system substrate-binding protein